MTRRAFARAGKVLSLNEYIHRATLGLPKTERLDAAAELRVHLLEQVSVLEAKGFAREEAEFLAVQSMGTVRLSPRSLLSRTRILGWTVLGLMSLATGSWWVYNNLMPPREGISASGELTKDDLMSLQFSPDAPHGFITYAGAILTYPKNTRSVYYAYITPNEAVIQNNALPSDNIYTPSGSWPGSYRYQERWTIIDQQGSASCPQDWNLYTQVNALSSKLSLIQANTGSPPGLGLRPQDKTGQPGCSGMKRMYGAQVPGREVVPERNGVLPLIRTLKNPALPLNRWTVLLQLSISAQNPLLRNLPPDFKDTSVYLAVLPSDQAASSTRSGAVFKRDVGGKISGLSYGGQSLPDIRAQPHGIFVP